MENTIVAQALSRAEFLQNLKDSQLLSEGEIEPAVKASATDQSAMSLAHELLAGALLTDYQLEAVWQRRFEDLRIGNYDVLAKLGQGGMGTVYKARHRRMKRLVAIKVLLRSLCQETAFIQRFQREVETVARLSHPNVVMAYDADEAAVGHFLVMEFVNGCDLASTVQNQGPLSIRGAVHCLVQAARGLEYAHQEKIIHRDIKPANLLLDAAGVVKVTDLGLARLNNLRDQVASKTGLTQAGGILGTVDFMCPEQAVDSTAVDHRADIYSLGCTLYFLLTGQAIYPGDNLMRVLLKHREAPIPSLKASRPECPAALDDLFRKMVAKSSADRPQTMTEVVKALEAIEATLTDAPGLPVRGSQGEAKPGLAGKPAPSPDPSQTLALQPPSTHHDTPLTLLLVEPSRTQVVIIRRYLEGLGLQPTATVPSGQNALEEIRKAAPQVIVTAMHLKDMTGVQLARLVHAEWGKASPGFVLISSESESQETGSLSQAGKAAILHKPFTLEQLAEALNLVAQRNFKPLPGASAASDPGLTRVGMGMAGSRSMVPVTQVPASRRQLVKVLLADDSASARVLVRGVLRGQGFTQLTEVTDGAQAVAAVAREAFDLVVTDYNMPGIDGLGLVAFLRQYGPSAKVPIILVTSEQDPGKLEAMRRLGVTAICDKSFPVETAREILDRLFP